MTDDGEAHVKVRKAGETRFLFLTPGGGRNALRIHAARYRTIAIAREVAAESERMNPGYSFKAVPAQG